MAVRVHRPRRRRIIYTRAASIIATTRVIATIGKIRETKRRVQELIGGQNGLTDPDSISRIVATECMNNLSNRRAI